MTIAKNSYANVWKTNRIVQLDPDGSRVSGWINLTGLIAYMDLNQPINMLNGIAYDAENNRLFVTGSLFEIELIPAG